MENGFPIERCGVSLGPSPKFVSGEYNADITELAHSV